jgi:hypothetical protein
MFKTIKFTDEGKTLSGGYYVHNPEYPLVTAVSDDGRQKTTQIRLTGGFSRATER